MCYHRTALSWVAALTLAGLLVIPGCSKKSAKPAKLTPENFVQKLVLDVDGKSVEIPLEKMDVFLVKRGNSPETYEVHGTGVVLAGTFPAGVRVEYGENWATLVGKPIAVSPKGGDRADPSESHLTLPGGAALKVIGGTITFAEVGEGYDAKTPLTGSVE